MPHNVTQLHEPLNLMNLVQAQLQLCKSEPHAHRVFSFSAGHKQSAELGEFKKGGGLLTESSTLLILNPDPNSLQFRPTASLQSVISDGNVADRPDPLYHLFFNDVSCRLWK